ncbi:MAG: hypothetical protein Q8M94_00550, partial [Ignavibacteria bacterium]|nr:hypothetical protein [Ignavibacteria bacterium]
MFENYIKQAKQKVLDKFHKNKQFITLKDILGYTDIDIGYKAYLTAEVNWWIYEEQMQRKINLNFNLEEPLIVALLQELDSCYFMNARFDIGGFKTVVDSAVKIRLNMAIRPRTTLKWFVFRGEPTKSFNEILLRLDYLADSRYIIEKFIQRAEKENIMRSRNDIFSVIEFEKLIEQIDNEKIYDLSPEDFTELTNPIFEYFNFNDSELNEVQAPVESFIIFLDDKELTPISKRLEEKFYSEDLKFFTKNDFLKFIYQIINEMESEHAEQSVQIATMPEINEMIPEGTVQFKEESVGNFESIEEMLDQFNHDDSALEEAAIHLDSESLPNVETHRSEQNLKVFDTPSAEILLEEIRNEIFNEEITELESSLQTELTADFDNIEMPYAFSESEIEDITEEVLQDDEELNNSVVLEESAEPEVEIVNKIEPEREIEVEATNL